MLLRRSHQNFLPGRSFSSCLSPMSRIGHVFENLKPTDRSKIASLQRSDMEKAIAMLRKVSEWSLSVTKQRQMSPYSGHRLARLQSQHAVHRGALLCSQCMSVNLVWWLRRLAQGCCSAPSGFTVGFGG